MREEVAAVGILHHDVQMRELFAELDVADNVWVVQLLQHVNLIVRLAALLRRHRAEVHVLCDKVGFLVLIKNKVRLSEGALS